MEGIGTRGCTHTHTHTHIHTPTLSRFVGKHVDSRNIWLRYEAVIPGQELSHQRKGESKREVTKKSRATMGKERVSNVGFLTDVLYS